MVLQFIALGLIGLVIFASAFILEEIKIGLLSGMAFLLIFIISYLIQIRKLVKKGYKRKKINFLKREIWIINGKKTHCDVYETVEENSQTIYHKDMLFQNIGKSKYAYCLKNNEPYFVNSIVVYSIVVGLSFIMIFMILYENIRWK